MEFEDIINTIQLGDCLDMFKSIPDKSIDLIVTDPPYLIENTVAGGKSKLAESIQKMNNEINDNNLVNGFNEKILDEIYRVMKTPNVYIWCNHKQIPMYLDYFVKNKGCSFDIIIWNKTNAMPLFNNKYLTDKEYCLYFRKNGYCNPKDYESAKTVYYQPINVTDKEMYKHPTIKPINIIKTLIENSSKPNDIVLDCFCGSGTTCVACKETGRRYIGMEINPEYYKIAVNRVNGILANGQITIFNDDLFKEDK